MKSTCIISKMKKIIFAMIISVVLYDCVGSPRNVDNPLEELDVMICEISTYFNNQLPSGINLAIINIESEYPTISEYIITTLMENLVNDGHFTVVDRHRLDAIREELMFQMSGEVDDNTAQAIGRMVGAQTIILGSFTDIANMHRLSIRALAVETAEIQGLFNQTISGSGLITAFTGREVYIGIGTRAGLFVNGNYQGAMDLFDAVDWINRNAVNRGDYIIVVGKDESVPPLSLSTGNSRITVTLRTDGPNRNITYDTPSRPSTSLFNIGTGVTLNLEEGINLIGVLVDSRPLIRIRGGTFIMNGGSIRDNFLTNSNGFVAWNGEAEGGGAVFIENNGNFVMNNGVISGNSAPSVGGGGVLIAEGATFIMNDGIISSNSGGWGGGVYSSGNFVMRGGIISENTATTVMINGGGVLIDKGTFTMHDGVIRDNSASFFGNGGGVSLTDGNFNMHGGIISGNCGSGVVSRRGDFRISFIKSGGIIYGTDAPDGLANIPFAAQDISSTLLIRNTTSREDHFMENQWPRRGWEEEVERFD